jgi:RNA polymerase sigma-70 factor (ECF subfamily)
MVEKLHISSLKKPENFEKVFKEYFQPLCFYSLRFVKDMDTAKDIVHGVFIRIWERRHEIDTQVPIRAYLFTSVHNRSLNYLRDSAKFESRDISELNPVNELRSAEETQLEDAELESRISTAISNLPDKCRKIFQMNRVDGKKYKEIADILELSVKTVEAQMSKALRLLREDLKDYIKVLIFLMIDFFRNYG